MRNEHKQRIRQRNLLPWVCCIASLVLCLSGFGATVEFDQASDPPGILTQTNFLSTPIDVSTLTAPASANGYHFVYWTLDDVRANDASGVAQNPATFTLLEPTVAIAHYVSESQDSDANGLPDWFEITYFGSIGQDPNADPDGDGYTVAQEYSFGLNPLAWEPKPQDQYVDGGISEGRSALVAINLQTLPTYTLRSIPDGLITTTTNITTNGTVVSTPDLWGQNISGYRFAYWDVDGVRQQDAYDVAVGSATFVVATNTVATAHFVLESDDTDANGLPDWFEMTYFGSLGQDPNSDPDGDGYTIAQEFSLGLNPAMWEAKPQDQYVDGGISSGRSDVVTINLQSLPTYTLLSSPDGFLDSTNIVTPGAVATTPNLFGQSVSGYRFVYWDLDGVVQRDASGVAFGSISFVVTTNRFATAHYVLESDDTDSNGLADWFEITYFGAIGQNLNADPDGDGYTIAQEFALGLNPTSWEPKPQDEYIDGGISSARAANNTIMDMQPFERLEYGLVDGVVSNIFTRYGGVGGIIFGTNAAPALGDWDGDGDLDVFVAFAPGGVRVFQNIGSRLTMNLSERTTNFTALSAAWSDIALPALALGDWSGDGKADLVVGGSGSTVRMVSSSGNFNTQSAPDVYTLATGSTNAIPALGDINGDGWVDLVLLLADGTVNVYTNTHNPSAPFFGPASIANLLGQPVPQACGIAVADIDYDGRLDLLVSDTSGRIWEFHRNATGSSYTLASKVWGGSGAGFAQRLTIAAGDLNGDGDVDLIGGFAQGGLLTLRDPRYSVPANVRAAGGAMSVFLEWDPDRQSRIAGYNIYRSYPDTNAFAMVNPGRVVVPRYEDGQAALRLTNFYRVTAITGVIYPGNSVPQYIESRPSDIVSAVPGGVTLWMSDYYGAPGGAAVLQINTPLASAISGTNLAIHILYNPAVLIPASQVDGSKPTVERTALTQNLVIADNGATANGEIIITGISGNIISGTGNLFDINFRVAAGVVVGAASTNIISSTTLNDTSGNTVPVTIQGFAQFTAATNYFPGDVNGDGSLSQADFDLALQLAVGQRAATPQEIAAGDLNGNGAIDKDDASMLLNVIAGQSPNPQ